MKFITYKKPLKYPVYFGSSKKIAIPKGARNVKIAFRQSPFTYISTETGDRLHMNVYIYQNRMIHA